MKTFNILILGASYGSLLGTKLALTFSVGHNARWEDKDNLAPTWNRVARGFASPLSAQAKFQRVLLRPTLSMHARKPSL